MNYNYQNEETPEERLRNKLSVIFLVIETGACDQDLIKQALSVIPDILIHLEDIEPFYKNQNNTDEQNQCKNCSRLDKQTGE